MKNLLVAQSGGPSAAINATLCGVVEKCLMDGNVDKIYGAKHGIQGVLDDDLLELNGILSDAQSLQLLCQTPSSALGSCRLKLGKWEENEAQYEQIISVFRKYNIGYFIYIGGNDSMDTIHKVSDYCAAKNITDIAVMGAPKTIDNDLAETDHCPGFASAAKYIATTFAELSCDCSVYSIPAVTIVEVMGRDAGWLTASSALARVNGASAPDLIYICELPFSKEQFLQDVRNELAKKPNVVVAISEGIKNEAGDYVTSDLDNRGTDAFGHKILAGAGKYLEEVVKAEIGCKVRSIELNLMQRCASHVASATDIYESRMLGSAAAGYAIAGVTGKMAIVRRTSDAPYRVEFDYAGIEKIANKVKEVPKNWMNPEGNDVTEEMMAYLLPLIQGELPCTYINGVPAHIRLF
ncbi:6-phosphofructokinase [Chakrabartyella piscis]|uniref:6-phosphofructokinase n=1 Tax=Chakrabartyella piscis TaxID=2918914 RepID=UPI002958401D|nr:6-phosphofructokinase [Chakrabartyella piscis]